jgi:putative oxidoreductase
MFARFKDFALLLGRIAVGVVFLAHGLEKWENGIDGTAKFFEQVGIPLPTLAAVFMIALEIVGSILFIVGFLTPLIGLAFVVDAGGALFSVHIGNGLTGQGGYELVLVLAAAGLALGFNSGRFSLDHVLFGRKRAATQSELQDA